MPLIIDGKMKKILLDTNFLMIPTQFKVDIFSQIDRIVDFNYRFYVLDRTVDELKSILDLQKGKQKEAAKIALKLISIKRISIIKTKSKKLTDDVIVEEAVKEGMIVATQDKELKAKLKLKNAALMVLRQKKKVIFLDPKGYD